MRDHLNQVDKYVVSQTLQDPAWERSTVLRGPLLDRVGELKSQPGKGIVVTGSLSLMPELVVGGVVDEYQLFVYPVVGRQPLAGGGGRFRGLGGRWRGEREDRHQHGCGQTSSSGYPFTAPAVTPSTIRRLRNRNSSSGGMVMRRMSANSRLYWVLNWLWKLNTVSWTVAFSSPGRK